MKKVERKGSRINNLGQLLMVSAWGAVLVIASFLFLFVGQWIDIRVGTEPFFMLGLFILSVSLVIARLYSESRKIHNQMGNISRRNA
jgi:hypothetical protein